MVCLPACLPALDVCVRTTPGRSHMNCALGVRLYALREDFCAMRAHNSWYIPGPVSALVTIVTKVLVCTS
jgi:hypothetical protein